MFKLFWTIAGLGALCGVLASGGIVADYVLPCIPAVERFIQSLPLAGDDTE